MSGVSLIEWMAAMCLSLLVIGTLFSLYRLAQNRLSLQVALVDIQNNADSALHILKSEIHQAGIVGCRVASPDFRISGLHAALQETRWVYGDNQSLNIAYADIANVAVLNIAENKILLSDEVAYKENDQLIISDCAHAEIVRVASVVLSHHTQVIYTETPLHEAYSGLTEARKLVWNRFYLKTKNQLSESTLVFEDISHYETELVTGIKSLHFEYKIRDAEGVKLVPADEILDWSSVIGVSMKFEFNHSLLTKPQYAYFALG